MLDWKSERLDQTLKKVIDRGLFKFLSGSDDDNFYNFSKLELNYDSENVAYLGVN